MSITDGRRAHAAGRPAAPPVAAHCVVPPYRIKIRRSHGHLRARTNTSPPRSTVQRRARIMLSLPGHVAHLNKEALVPAREKPEHPAHAQGQSSPLWPQSSVGGGMAAGAAFAHPRAADARVRPIFLTHR